MGIFWGVGEARFLTLARFKASSSNKQLINDLTHHMLMLSGGSVRRPHGKYMYMYGTTPHSYAIHTGLFMMAEGRLRSMALFAKRGQEELHLFRVQGPEDLPECFKAVNHRI